jgi:hypothetical protein
MRNTGPANIRTTVTYNCWQPISSLRGVGLFIFLTGCSVFALQVIRTGLEEQQLSPVLVNAISPTPGKQAASCREGIRAEVTTRQLLKTEL